MQGNKDEGIFQEGWNARKKFNATVDDNPYPDKKSTEHYDWFTGWRCADEDMKKKDK